MALAEPVLAEDRAFAPFGIPLAGWRALATGAGIALVWAILPVSFLLLPLVTLVHEIGHTAMSWLFGIPALPAFDFTHGGGLTLMDGERSWLLVACVVGMLGTVAYRGRGRPRVWMGAALVGALYLLSIDRAAEHVAISVMGHGRELAFAAVFLARALTGWGCKLAMERPLYGFIGCFVLLHDVGFAWGLMRSAGARELYYEGKAGLENDFVVVASILGWRLESLGAVFLLATFAVIPVAVAVARAWLRLAGPSDFDDSAM